MSEGEQSDDTLRLHVSVGDVTVEVEGTVDEAETWFEALREDYLTNIDSNEGQPSNSSSATNSDGSGSQVKTDGSQKKSRTLAEFYQMVEDISKRDTALLTGWYLENQEGLSTFTKDDLRQKAKSAKLTLGKNVSRDLSNQIADGNLAEDGDQDGDQAYYVTLTGEEYIEEELLGY
ncbi:hypothetical protein [Natrinema altunense]|uniref:Uncharacterized protein n=1 Tax=Natrinema altunense TaxID=222984 RepID=A0A482XZI3_9EURY|nr:hypothetical protein [Natrinema altunense]RZH67990.1 hypothetical protein ELS17_00520 [Natrinema altunense]